MPKIKYSQLVEVVVPAGTSGGQSFYFADQPQLRGKVVDSVEVVNSLDVTTSPITAGNAIITPAQMELSFLTLFLTEAAGKQAIGEQINKVPLTLLHRVQSNATGTNSPFVLPLFQFDNYIVNWDKSYITVASPGITTAPSISYLLNVYYR